MKKWLLVLFLALMGSFAQAQMLTLDEMVYVYNQSMKQTDKFLVKKGYYLNSEGPVDFDVWEDTSFVWKWRAKKFIKSTNKFVNSDIYFKYISNNIISMDVKSSIKIINDFWVVAKKNYWQ